MGAVRHDLAVQYLEVSELNQHPDNANSGDIEAIRDSIRVNGFTNPLLVQRRSKLILAGNHRYAAAISLGISKLPVILLEVDDVEAKRIMVSDNRTNRLGRVDEALELELLQSIIATDDGLAGTGYDYSDYSDLQALAGESYEAPFEDEVVPERHVEFTTGAKVKEAEVKKRLPFTITPVVDEDGHTREFTVEAVGLGTLMPRDLNEIRVAFGYAPLTREEMRSYGVPRWHPK